MANPRSTKLVLMGVVEPLRFSAEEIRVMRFACHLLAYWIDDMRMSSFDSELCQKLGDIEEELKRLAIDQTAKSHRVNADTFAIAALAFALRGLHRKRRPRPGCFPYRWPRDTKQTALLKRLENARRRSVRKWLRIGSADCYKRWHERWLRFMKLIQAGLRPRKWRELEETRNEPKRIVDQVVKNTKEMLAELHPDQPFGEWDLRRIVRAALHHVRQDRALVSEHDLVLPTKYGREFLEEFVVKRLRRLFWEKVHAACALQPSPPEEEEEDEAFATILEASHLKAAMEKVAAAWKSGVGEVRTPTARRHRARASRAPVSEVDISYPEPDFQSAAISFGDEPAAFFSVGDKLKTFLDELPPSVDPVKRTG